MKHKIASTRLCHLLNSGQTVFGFGSSPPRSKFIPKRSCISVVTTTVLICLAFSFCMQSASAEWEIMAAHEKEFVSDDVSKDLPGKGTETSVLVIPDAGAISDLNVKLNITHPYCADLDVYLIAPDGTRVELFTDVGVVSEDFIDTIIDNEADQSITDGRGPFEGSFRPEGNLAELYGKDIEGTWTLEITDDWSSSRSGTLNAWSLIITIEDLESLSPPFIQAEAGTPGGIYDTILWEDIGDTRRYDSDVPEAIPDEGTLTSELAIDDAGAIQDLNVMLNIRHSRDADLDVFLIAPDGKKRIALFTDVGDSGDNFEETILDDEAEISITDGSAPFTGYYRPEGHLAELIGLDICGTWTLEISDDSRFSSGTLNSWSLIADIADIAYYGQCATNADFGKVISDSGWITNTSYQFTGLDDTDTYWYRVKARSLESWFQTQQEDFEKDILTDVQITDEGDVILAGSGGNNNSELDVISDPSFESDNLDGWYADLTTFDIMIGAVSNDFLWASDGTWAGCMLFFSDFSYHEEDLAVLFQPVDWTGVDTLVFDYASWGYADLLVAAVFIGEDLVWLEYGTDASAYPPDYISPVYDVTIDVSGFEGEQDLGLAVQSVASGRFDAGILWDNLRTYGASGYAPSGHITSTPMTIGETDIWNVLAFNATIPKGTELTFDILPAEGSDPIPGYVDILNGTDLSGLSEKTIRVRANLSTDNPAVTPILHDWSITYTDAIRESQWSNIVSSLPNTK